MLRYIFVSTLLILAVGVRAQRAGNRILTGPEGAVLQLRGFDSDLQKMKFLPAGSSIEVYKSVGNGSSRKLATVTFPSSSREMQQRLGDELTATVVQQLKVKNAEEAYTKLLNGGPDQLAFLLFLRPVMEAFGLVYVDKTWTKGQAAGYSLQLNSGGVKTTIADELLATDAPPSYDPNIRFRLSRFTVSDSSMTAVWSAKLVNSPCYFAQPMRSDNRKGSFDPVPQLSMAYQEGDSIFVQYDELLTPGARVRYYIRPTDWAGNLGLPSDTLHVLAVDAKQFTGITGLMVTDTLNGLLLTWNPLPREAVYAGIQILKSRQVGSDYVVLDTVDRAATSYLDTRLVPNVTYYYKVAPIYFRVQGREEPPFAEAMGVMAGAVKDEIPQKPMGVRASVVDGKINVRWDPSPDLNLFGYQVLRGTSPANLTVVSGTVKAHEYWDTAFAANFSGEYVYAVKAISQSQRTSEISDLSSVSIRQPIILPAPGGITARREGLSVFLEWDHSHFGNLGIVGYFLYSRNPGETYFKQLNSTPLKVPNFLDSTSFSKEYAVTTTDIFGNQSILSSVTRVEEVPGLPIGVPDAPKLANRTNGISVAWPVPYHAENLQYCIYRKLVTETTFRRIATVDPSQPFIDTTAQKDKLYEYAISVLVNGKNESDRSTSSSIRRQ